jgi:hypothetical protein
MKLGILSFVVPVLGLVFMTGCDGGTGGDGDGDGDVGGPYPADALSEARDIATPVAEEWDDDAFCYQTKGFVLDKDGILVGPEVLTGDADYWELDFNAGGDEVLIVTVSYDGTYDSYEDTLYPEDELPTYGNEHVKDLMHTADDAFQENVGEEEYLYRLTVGTAEVNLAMVEAFYPTVDDFKGFVFLDADTLEILDTSW